MLRRAKFCLPKKGCGPPAPGFVAAPVPCLALPCVAAPRRCRGGARNPAHVNCTTDCYITDSYTTDSYITDRYTTDRYTTVTSIRRKVPPVSVRFSLQNTRS